jgi:magnesium transporter
MPESLSNTSDKIGMPPGSLVHVGNVIEPETTISLIDYSKASIEEQQIHAAEELTPYKATETVTWVNIEGLVDTRLIESVGTLFNIHPLVLEDILNTHQRPKFEDHGDYLFIVLKHLSFEKTQSSLKQEQISILVLQNFVITFRETRDSLFRNLKLRLQNGKGRIRRLGPDYLTYAILDTIVDQNFVLLDNLDETIDAIEEELLTKPAEDTLGHIQRVRRDLVYIRKTAVATRDLFKSIVSGETTLIGEKMYIYYKDVYDHALRITEAIESHRDILAGMHDLYISSISNKMNEIMKILTVFASIFIPLTFIAGIYGMNFEYMPELQWKWAYPTLWVLFVTIPLVLLTYFRRKKWL